MHAERIDFTCAHFSPSFSSLHLGPLDHPRCTAMTSTEC